MDFDLIVIGAGAVGLAVAAELASRGSVLVVEREDGIGRGISSRNSEVVHAGIYYQPGSLKARLCVEGRRLIEGWAAQGRFGYRRAGKFIVAVEENERPALQALLEQGRANGVAGLRWAEPGELEAAEPAVAACAALWSPDTGILDSHGLMRFLLDRAQAAGAQLALRSRVVALRSIDSGWELSVVEDERAEAVSDEVSDTSSDTGSSDLSSAADTARGPRTVVSARRVVNAAGLHADQIAALAGIDVAGEGLRQYWSRGEYFAPAAGRSIPFRHLIYPVPPAEGQGHLGIHVTVDLGGGVRFGPSAQWPDPVHSRREDYRQDGSLRGLFAASLRRFLPGLEARDLEPAGVGLRPRLRPARDFVIREESGRGLPGLLTLVGVESPGLTCAPAIAREVARLLAMGPADWAEGML